MKRYTIILFLLCTLSAMSKTTYIPTYYGLIRIAMGTDTIATHDKTVFVGLISQDSTVAISINHEVVDADKVKAIKRARRIAGWATASAVLSGVSACLNTGNTPAAAARRIESLRNMEISADLAKFAYAASDQEKVLQINFTIENLSDNEISVADMERGLVWYILPHQYLNLSSFNPDMANLRIANTDPFHQDVKYVVMEAGSSVSKQEIKYENEECWIWERRRDIWDLMGYTILYKTDFTKQNISVEEGEELIKQMKKEAEEKR